MQKGKLLHPVEEQPLPLGLNLLPVRRNSGGPAVGSQTIMIVKTESSSCLGCPTPLNTPSTKLVNVNYIMVLISSTMSLTDTKNL